MTLEATLEAITASNLSTVVSSIRVARVGTQGPPGQAVVAGVFGGALYPEPTYLDNGDFTVTIGTSQWALYSNANFAGSTSTYEVTTDTFTVPLGTSFIICKYNSGSPIYAIITDVNEINESDVCPVNTLANDGMIIHREGWNSLGSGLANKIHTRFVKTDRFANEEGNSLSEDGSRHVLISAGIVWLGAHRFTTPDFNSEDGTLDATGPTLFYFYQKGGPLSTDWTSTFVNVYDNTNYNPQAGGLTEMGTNRYTVIWVYRDLDANPHGAYVLHDEQYTTLSQANGAQPRNDLPSEFTFTGLLVGRIIIQKSASSGIVESAFTNVFQGTPVTDHESLSNLLGGDTTHYHLTQSEHATNALVADTFIRGGTPFTGLIGSSSSVQPTTNTLLTLTDSNADDVYTLTLNIGVLTVVGGTFAIRVDDTYGAGKIVNISHGGGLSISLSRNDCAVFQYRGAGLFKVVSATLDVLTGRAYSSKGSSEPIFLNESAPSGGVVEGAYIFDYAKGNMHSAVFTAVDCGLSWANLPAVLNRGSMGLNTTTGATLPSTLGGAASPDWQVELLSLLTVSSSQTFELWVDDGSTVRINEYTYSGQA